MLNAILAVMLIAAAPVDRTPATVVKVVDGDTIDVLVAGQTVPARVRLIGIDAPESSVNRRAYKQAERTGRDLAVILEMGKRSAAELAAFLKPGDPVTLEFDVERCDRYGRTLAYVYTADGTMVNLWLLKKGLAVRLTVPPNVKHAEEFGR